MNEDIIIEDIARTKRPKGPIETVEQFLARGGTITVLKPKRTEKVEELKPKRSRHWGFGAPEKRTPRRGK